MIPIDMNLLVMVLIIICLILVCFIALKDPKLAWKILETLLDVIRDDPELRENIDAKEEELKKKLPPSIRKHYERYISIPDDDEPGGEAEAPEGDTEGGNQEGDSSEAEDPPGEKEDGPASEDGKGEGEAKKEETADQILKEIEKDI